MVIKTVRDTLLNFNPGMLAFVAHRVTGVALSVYLILHILTLSSVVKGPEQFNEALKYYDNPFGHFMEFLLLVIPSTC